jgi:hypothetical protein
LNVLKEHSHQSTVEADINQAHIVWFDSQMYQARPLVPSGIPFGRRSHQAESPSSAYCFQHVRASGQNGINFAVLRRSHSTLHKQRNSDVKIIADQQGHGLRTHLDNYVQSGVAERKAQASKLYADFIGVLRQTGSIEVDAFRRDL